MDFTGPRAVAEAACQILEQAAAPPALAVSFFEIEGTANFHARVLYDQEPPRQDLATLLVPLGQALEFSIGILPDTDWVLQSRQGLTPIRAGRFFVASQDYIGAAPAGTLPLMIEAGLAFGTGHHATTQGCLIALDRLARAQAVRTPLDLGCGAGVLGLAAAKLWRCKVWLSDIDPVAVTVAKDNARKNQLSPLCRTLTADGLHHPALARAGPFDLIIANILARPLVTMAPDMARALTPGGCVILSGLLSSQENRVLSAYGHQGLSLHRRVVIEGWSTLVLKR